MVALHRPPPSRGRPLTDAGAVVLAGAAVGGCLMGRSLPMALAVAGAGMTIVARRPWMLWVAAALFGSILAARAEAGLRPAAPAAQRGTVTMVSDPEPTFGGVRAIVRSGRRRLELNATGGAAGAVRASLAGERLAVDGRVRPPTVSAPWLRVRHVVGRLDVATAERVDAGATPWRQANSARRLLERGAASLPPAERSLFAGFVLGDDREQSAVITDDFRAAGLTHLLVVSGENVAFVLALVGPAVRRLRLWARWVVTLAVIGFFTVVTRAEPSVLRASAMAALAVSAVTIGRKVAPLRLLALAVTALVLIDPLLVESVGFRLSVAASLGITTVAPRLAEALPGPRPLAEALAVTLAAQLGVAPVLISSFGGMPVASIPANLLAAPVAGVVMMWGVGAGVVAGVLGGRVAVALHVPTRLLVGWIEGVARICASAPLGELGGVGIMLFAGGVGAGVVARRRGRRGVAAIAAGVAVTVLVAPAVALRTATPDLRVEVAPGVVLWREAGATVVGVESSSSVRLLLEGLRRSGVRRLDLVVVGGGGPAAAERVAALRHRWQVRRVLQPAGGTVPAAVSPAAGSRVTVGDLDVAVLRGAPRLVVAVSAAASASVASRPP